MRKTLRKVLMLVHLTTARSRQSLALLREEGVLLGKGAGAASSTLLTGLVSTTTLPITFVNLGPWLLLLLVGRLLIKVALVHAWTGHIDEHAQRNGKVGHGRQIGRCLLVANVRQLVVG